MNPLLTWGIVVSLALFGLFVSFCNSGPRHHLPEPGRPPWLRGGYQPRGHNADGRPSGPPPDHGGSGAIRPRCRHCGKHQ